MQTTYAFLDVDIVLNYSDGTQEVFRLQAPNAGDPFSFSLRRINILPAYRDGNFLLQKGFEKYQFACTLNYDWHRMDKPWKLLAAETIELRIPPSFSADPVATYQRFDVFLENNEVFRNWLQGLILADDGATKQEANPAPPGSLSLQFAGITPFTEQEFLENIEWDQPVIITQNAGDGTLIEFTEKLQYRFANVASNSSIILFGDPIDNPIHDLADLYDSVYFGQVSYYDKNTQTAAATCTGSSSTFKINTDYTNEVSQEIFSKTWFCPTAFEAGVSIKECEVVDPIDILSRKKNEAGNDLEKIQLVHNRDDCGSDIVNVDVIYQYNRISLQIDATPGVNSIFVDLLQGIGTINIYLDGLLTVTEDATNFPVEITGLDPETSYNLRASYIKSSGKESDLTQKILVTTASAVNKYSLSFDGIDDYIISDQPYDGIGDFTFELYFKSSTTSLGNFIALRQSAVGSGGFQQLLVCRIFADGTLGLTVRNSAGTVYSLNTISSYNNNVWFRAIFSRQGTEFKIRVLDATSTIIETVTLAGVSDDVVDTNAKLILGTYSAGTDNEWYAGLMDDTRIWNSYRSDTQIVNNNNSKLIGNESGLIWYAPAESGTGTILDDITAGNRDGTISGATWSTDTPF